MNWPATRGSLYQTVMATREGVLVAMVFAARAWAAAGPSYVGAQSCRPCHAAEFAIWSGSRHSKMVQPATTLSVRGNFSLTRVTLRGESYLLRSENGTFYITESYLTGRPQEHRIDYTLGNRRIQHYLTTLADGRVIVLPPSWDIQRHGWFHNLDIADPEFEPGVQVQVWNKQCYSCHVSQEEKHFTADTLEYRTTWLNFGTNCERCHGPGSDHVAHYRVARRSPGPQRDIVLQTRLDAERNTMVCAQCHSFRDIYVSGYTAGSDYYDYFLPVMPYALPHDDDPAYWADGRTRRFSNDALGLWQSPCFLKGRVTCVDCHAQPHATEIERNPQLRPDANALCTRCHESIGHKLEVHTHHAARSTGSSCVECHMPRTVFSIKTEIRDHSMSIPAPENTIRHRIPNACNQCHRDRDAGWALARMNQWYPSASRRKAIRRADSFALADAGDSSAVPGLLQILADSDEGQFLRANAAGYLSRFPSEPGVGEALQHALSDQQPLVRAIAVRCARPSWSADPSAVTALLERALADPVAIVRMGAAVSLVAMGVRRLDGEDQVRFETAQQLYMARAALNADDAGQDVAAGKFYYLLGQADRAIAAFRLSLQLDPAIPAQYFLGGAYAAKGDLSRAHEILEAIPPADEQYTAAQRLLRRMQAEERTHQ
jgi:predicted CXXCH cytochrome family protein